MTGASSMTVQILVDGWPDDIIEAEAWVEVTDETPDDISAVAFLQSKFPLEDRAEDEGYTCVGEKEWFQPMGEVTQHGSYRVFDSAVVREDDPRFGQPPGFTEYDPVEGPWVEVEPVTRDIPITIRSAPTDAKLFWVINVTCLA